jgi:hypothetical protein
MATQIEQATVDLVLEGDEEYLLENVGKKCVQYIVVWTLTWITNLA